MDAFLDLVGEGDPHPSVAHVADRSGVSHRSVFRYFADRDEMARTSIVRGQERLGPLLRVRIDPDRPLGDRVGALISHRLELYEAVGSIARLSRSLAPRQPIIQAQLAATRAQSRAGLTRVFAAELAGMSSSQAADALAAIDVLLSFESVELLRNDQALSPPRVASVLRGTVLALLAKISD